MDADLFSSDSFKKQVLESEGISCEEDNFKSLIQSAPQIPKGVKNIIQDASILSRNDKEQKAQELNMSLNQVMTKYNKEYGLDLNIDFSSMSRTLVAISDPKDRRTLELYLSEIFQSIRPVLILQMISKLSLAIDYVMDPQRMFSGELQLSDIWICIEKILQYIQQLEDMKNDILIKGADLELKKLGDQKEHEDTSIENSDVVKDFMKMFKKDNGL